MIKNKKLDRSAAYADVITMPSKDLVKEHVPVETKKADYSKIILIGAVAVVVGVVLYFLFKPQTKA